MNIFIRSTMTTLILALFPAVVMAAEFRNPLASKITIDILRGLILSVIYVGTPALVVAIVWTGFLFIAASGNSEGLNKAKSMAVHVLIGGVILLSLWAIVRMVGNTLVGLSSGALLIILSVFFLYVFYKK